MESLKNLIILVALILLSCSNNKNENKQNVKKVGSAKNTYDVCYCNKKAIKLVDDATVLRKKFSSLEELKSNKKAKMNILKIAKTFTELSEKCFTNNASTLFVPSDCNNVELLELKQNELLSLGIKINQGSKVWK
tara:strand:- start:184 stop:588 length:405 start_codon:yes stop_codon:yes gene_type:complete